MAVRDFDYERERARRRYAEPEEREDYRDYRDRDDRGFVDRASDEVRSWFGDDEAQRRRRMDERGYWNGRTAFGLLCAGDLMTRDVAMVHPRDSVERAARLMKDYYCGALPVVDEDDRLIGMITDRDITVRLVARGVDPRRSTIRDCMTDERFFCRVDDPLEDCMQEISRHRIRRLPIVDNQDRVVGIISQSDLARHAGSLSGRGERRALAEVLREVSEPSRESYRS